MRPFNNYQFIRISFILPTTVSNEFTGIQSIVFGIDRIFLLVPNDNNSGLVQVMALRETGYKPLSEPMMT